MARMVVGCKSLWSLALALVVLAGSAHAAVVEIPDKGLKDAIRLAIDKPTGDLTDADLAASTFTGLNASFKGITDLTGIKYCVNLASLQLHGNMISNISELAFLTHLQDLYLWNNLVEDLSPLSALANLRYVFLQNNKIADITTMDGNTGIGAGDVVNLSGNVLVDNVGTNYHGSLTSLCNGETGMQTRGATVYFNTSDCGSEQVPFVDENLKQCVRLDLIRQHVWSVPKTIITKRDVQNAAFKELRAGNASIEDLTGLDYCTKLTTVRLSGNTITSIEPLKRLGVISALYLDGNQIQDLTPLAASTSLLEVQVQNNQVRDIAPLGTLTELQALNISNNPLSSLTPLVSLINLTQLSLAGTLTSDLTPVHGLSKLVVLDVGSNSISSVSPLSGLFALQQLNISDNQIVNIVPLQNLAYLRVLNASANQIDNIDVLPALTLLRQVFLDTNKLTNISALAGLPVLDRVYLQNNKISDMSPLVANAAIASGDRVDVRKNPLSQENLCNDIPNLQDRGVFVDFDGTCAPAGSAYTLLTSVGPLGGGTIDPAPGARTYAPGTQITVTATADAGQRFDHWEGDVTGTDNPLLVTMDSDKRVIAVFGPENVNYTLTLETPTHGTIERDVEPTNGYYSAGTKVTLTAVPEDGYQFDNWTGDATGTTSPTIVLMNANKTVGAVFSRIPQYYNLTTSVFGNGTISPAPGVAHVYAEQTVVPVTATPDLGWRFDHWEQDLSGTVTPSAVVMTRSKSVRAVFVRDGLDFTLALGVQGSGSTTPLPGLHRYNEGDVVAVAATPADSWVFDHWAGDLTGENPNVTVTMNSDKSATAVFLYAPVSYVLVVGGHEGGSVSPDTGSHRYIDGKKLTVVATPDNGYEFDHWEGDFGGSENPLPITMNSDKTIAAVFRKSPFISNIIPAQGSTEGGTSVLILGLSLEGVSSVRFGGTAATIQSTSSTQIQVTAPAHERGAVDVVVETVNGTATRLAGFTYIEPPGPPELGTVTPNEGSVEGGEVATIRGHNLQLTQLVLFGGVEAEVLPPASETRLAVVVPPHAAGPVSVEVVTTSGVDSLFGGYTYYPRPTLTNVSPSEGPTQGGNSVTLTGTGLTSVKTVLFGDAVASITSISNSTLVVTAPTRASAGFVDVRVITRGGAALLAGAYEYYSGVASLTIQVYNSKTLTPLPNALVVITPGGLDGVTGADGQLVFPRVRPRSYAAVVSAANYTQSTRAFSVLPNAQATESFFLTPTKVTPQGCGALFGQLSQNTKEMAMPASIDDLAGAVIAPDAAIALRLTSKAAVAPASVWAQVLDADGKALKAEVVWRPTTQGDDTDGWAIVYPAQPLPVDSTVAVTVGALDAAGNPLEAVTRHFLVAVGSKQADGPTTVVTETNVTALPGVLAGAQSVVYRITPSRVFDSPVAVRIPVAGGADASALDVYYYAETGAEPGWYRGAKVEGWLAAAPNIVTEDGQTYIELLVNHAGIVQLGQKAIPVQGSTGTSRSAWMSLVGTLLGLSLLLGRLARRGPARG